MKRLWVILFFSIPIFSQDYYGILGWRNTQIDANGLLMDFAPYYNDYQDNGLRKIYTGNPTGVILGLGYKKYGFLKRGNIFNSYYFKWETDYFDLETIDYNWDEKNTEEFSIPHLSLGSGVGIITKDGFTVDFSLEYNAYTDHEWDYNNLPKNNYFSFDIKLGYSFNFNKGVWKSPVGLYYSKPINKEFINPVFQNSSHKEFLIEMPATWLAGGVIIAGAIAVLAESPSNYGSDYHWDQFYNQYGTLIWRCRTDGGPNSGEFAPDSKCAGKLKTDSRWPAKRAIN